ncbi:MAG TPA: alpha-amylase, partial [Anaerolineae bacterium]|nr:alpha-amylase [Anaerolineae bacterium]
TYVWLDQLSRQYKRDIHRLDQVPDEELDTLARRGFSGLWLIGLWERSLASRKIKQLCGNPEAEASAYSLYDYIIAADLGGEEAYRNLRERAWQRGIRLASDMVPNHVGIYSKWVIEHPDWFIALDHCPFPSYRFSGPDLSEDERVGIFIEDHYYDRSDAAVVFKRLDRWTGTELYIYHGNDGTAMPWNDTAQLNYLKPEVREAVIQTILHVARQFPIIRFDAAMTLTKKHFQRLWFPEPGSGGAIPTRAEYGLTREQFDAAMPNEFWREVVDRVAAEAPDTLLLAEAFWLLEGYFVRTLGMHRVYNSAFMHMLRDEDNAKYRQVMKNTLEFDPEILKRFVNFMNNPDEETAVAQFGKGDKYFGVCTLLATLPGLPMFGHGQVEGLAEKYGMEYRRAYWDEQPDPWLVERHERQIFPLLHRRYLFAEVRNFLLYDFVEGDGPDGRVNEDVFAYSNRAGEERALVVYHNRFATARGRIRESAAFAVKRGGERQLVRRTLGQGLGLRADEGLYYRFRDHVSGLEYLRSGRELVEQGLYVELDAYHCHVFLDWREVQDDERGRYRRLAAYLGGRGVPSIEEALQEVALQPVLTPFRQVVHADFWRRLMGRDGPEGAADAALLDEAEDRLRTLLGEIQRFTGGEGDPAAIARRLRRELAVILALPGEGVQLDILLGWLFTHALGRIVGEEGFAARSRSWLDEWFLSRRLAAVFQDLGRDEEAARWAVETVKMLVGQQGSLLRAAEVGQVSNLPYPSEGKAGAAHRLLIAWLRDGDVQRFLQVNRYGGGLWFNHEAFEQLLDWMLTLAAVQLNADPDLGEAEAEARLDACRRLIARLREAEAESEYQVVKLIEAVSEGEP